MTTFRITDLPARQAKAERFLGDTFRVISRSGLHPAEALLIEHLPCLTAGDGPLLVAGNRTGAAALVLSQLRPEASVVCHAFDLHHARAIMRNLAANGAAPSFVHDPWALPPPDLASGAAPQRYAVACTASLPPGPYSAALFMSTPGTLTGELLLDQLEDIHENLADGGTCLLACEGASGPLLKQLRALFGNLSIRSDRSGLICAVATRRAGLARRRDFSATFEASLPGGPRLTLHSLPGVFCHRRPDAGGLALAEIASREPLGSAARALDLGCGCGLVGLLLAQAQPGLRVTFADSHARALAATRLNIGAAESSGHTLLLSDTGTGETGFDLFVANPPYYSDFRIARLFIETAYHALRPGGACLLVSKATESLRTLQSQRFGGAEVIPRRGYGVVRSLRP